jgi:RNA polymerase sigma-70 factor (ECF subfamily)
MASNRDTQVKLEFEQVVDRYWEEILGYLWRMYSGAPEAEDSFQETFLRAFKAYPQLDRDANVRAWLYRIATNVARTAFKRNLHRQRREQVYAEGVSQRGKSPDEAVQESLLLDQVVGMVSKLPYKQRAAFMLRKYQGCTYLEIASILECSEDAARANLYQALQKLKSEAHNLELGISS